MLEVVAFQIWISKETYAGGVSQVLSTGMNFFLLFAAACRQQS